MEITVTYADWGKSSSEGHTVWPAKLSISQEESGLSLYLVRNAKLRDTLQVALDDDQGKLLYEYLKAIYE